jgi:hypothetical protein
MGSGELPLEQAPDDHADPLGKPKNAAQRKLVAAHLADAERVLDALNAARQRVIAGAREIRPSYSALALVADLGLAVGEAEVRSNPDAAQWFDAVSPFRPENFERRLARTLDPGAEADRDADERTRRAVEEHIARDNAFDAARVSR